MDRAQVRKYRYRFHLFVLPDKKRNCRLTATSIMNFMNVVSGKPDASQATVVQVNSTTIRGGNISQPLSILSASYTRESELQKSVTSRM